MANKVTNKVLESYLNCRLKGHLKLHVEVGGRSESEFAAFCQEVQAEFECTTMAKILDRYHVAEVKRNVSLDSRLLNEGQTLLFHAIAETDSLSICFDGLKKVPGESSLGDFHYLPILFCWQRKIGREQKMLLALFAHVLADFQERAPRKGIIVHGPERSWTMVQLEPLLPTAKKLFHEILQLQSAESPPKLFLNDHCPACEFRERCHAQAVQEDTLSLLRGIGEKEIKLCARKGIFTLTQFSHTFRPRRKGKRAAPRKRRYFALQAMALRDKTVYVFGTPKLQTNPVSIFLDIESKPDEDFVYLIGLIVDDGISEKRYSFWACNKSQESAIFEQFLATVTKYEEFSIFCYGSYEKTYLSRMRKVAKRKKQVDKVLNSLVNTLSLVYAHVYFPSYSNGLKDIGACLGCTWSETATGLTSIVWRHRWEATNDDAWKGKLVQYNLEDCAALKSVTEFVQKIGSATTAQEPPAGMSGLRIASVDDLDKLNRPRQWGPVSFFHSEYEFINDCAYFDYQRQRVYVRTSKTIRKSVTRQKKLHGTHVNRNLRVSHRVQISSSKCPFCKSADLLVNPKDLKLGMKGPRVKRALDLVITPGAIKRKVIECRTHVHKCRACHRTFVPKQYERLAMHLHGLVGWTMYQHVAHRVSFRKVEDMLWEFFGLKVHEAELPRLKHLMAGYYKTTYQRILRKIVTGSLAHVDETYVQLRTGKAYVWVFANMEEVVYMHRQTREGDFLQDLLSDFKGVLVSDFYSAYDALHCPQQKCLIHLMRDMNQELLNNPYDEEIQSITLAFGKLLQEVVATIDEHGLKRLHLKKHDKSVVRFFEEVMAWSLQSDPAKHLRDRLLRNQNKLFTFLNYDGVLWNNNNAENAIKRFAYYRQHTVGQLTENGLKDYLVLLSIYQTCRYKGISFLKFLLSKERDIDSYLQGKRPKRRRSTLEMYPKGFVLHRGTRFRISTKVADDGCAEPQVVRPPGGTKS